MELAFYTIVDNENQKRTLLIHAISKEAAEICGISALKTANITAYNTNQHAHQCHKCNAITVYEN